MGRTTPEDEFSGLDKLAPGAAAAARLGKQLAQRSIDYASRDAAYAVPGVLEEITPSGDNPVSSIGNSWLGKIAKAAASAERSCCCDAANVVQPCGPCRCDDHDQCADLR